MSKYLWFNYFKRPIDSRPDDADKILLAVRDYFFKSKWYEVYDLLEYLLTYKRYGHKVDISELAKGINFVLERELAPFRFVGKVFTEITDVQETEMLKDALESSDFPNVSAHLHRALELLSDRSNADFRNSIKESISAVEALARVITHKPKASLGDALKALDKSGKIHAALKEGFSSIYGYTSDEGGIRHAMLDEPNLTIDDAKFFLLACTSFINYLKSKM